MRAGLNGVIFDDLE